MTKGSFFANVLDYFGDSRISRKEKIWITIGTILYVISPLDLLPGLPFDDIGVLGIVLAYMNWRMKKNTDTSTKIDKVDILPGEIIKEPEDFQKNFFSDKK